MTDLTNNELLKKAKGLIDEGLKNINYGSYGYDCIEEGLGYIFVYINQHDTLTVRVADLEAMVGELAGATEWYRKEFHRFRHTEPNRDYQAEMDEKKHDLSLAKAHALVPEVEG